MEEKRHLAMCFILTTMAAVPVNSYTAGHSSITGAPSLRFLVVGVQNMLEEPSAGKQVELGIRFVWTEM